MPAPSAYRDECLRAQLPPDSEEGWLQREGVRLNETTLALLLRIGQRENDQKRSDNASGDTPKQCTCKGSVVRKLPKDVCQPAKTWVCEACGAVYFGKMQSPAGGAFPADVALTPSQDVTLPPEVDRAFDLSWERKQAGAERRLHPRYKVTLPAVVVPLDKRLTIVGDPVRLRTLDISKGGLCLKHITSVERPFLYVDFRMANRPRVRMLAEIVRCLEREGAYEIGCKFVSRVAAHRTYQLCSVADCSEAASCEVIHVDVTLPGGRVVYKTDETCPYLCSRHVAENELRAHGSRKPQGMVCYPHTNRQNEHGFSIYRPLDSC